MHTSSVIVFINENENTDVSLTEDDVSLSWFSGSGAGGQHRNKHDNCCRVTHRETGIVATGQSYKERPLNKKEAFSNLVSKLEQLEMEKNEKKSLEYRTRAGTGQRGDKIRTIRFQDDIAKDHRTNKKITAKKYFGGKIDEIW